jgi:hypothetical protein
MNGYNYGIRRFRGCDYENNFWDVTPCNLVGMYQSFEGTCCFLLQDRRMQWHILIVSYSQRGEENGRHGEFYLTGITPCSLS